MMNDAYESIRYPKGYKVAFEEFCSLYSACRSFALLVNSRRYSRCDKWTSLEAFLEILFEDLWKRDKELLIRDKKGAINALIKDPYPKVKE